ncbi:MAG: GGDEF domain-containing protein [Candidatus Cloacimonetes bacterium]|nr:GGDEF domain-containing protein [Candidatus Cloacimonadota bacterium]
MYYNVKRLFAPLIFPSLLIILSMIIGWQWDRMLFHADIDNELTAFIVIFPLIPYLLFVIVAILGVRSNNSGLILCTIILTISYFILNLSSSYPIIDFNFIIPRIISFLLPINIFLFTFVEKKKIRVFFLYIVIILIEVGVIRFLYYLIEFPESKIIIQFYTEFPKLAASLLVFTQYLYGVFLKTSLIDNIPVISLFTFIMIIVLLIAKFVSSRDVRNGGYLFVTISVFLAVCSSEPVPTLMLFFTASGLILLITTIEASFSMAYIDELTGLHGRRSLNETLSTLNKNYAIAMIDIDHFKKFNDRYGHKTGDQVLKMVAAKLSEVNSGAKSFRYGGEEFTTIFPGKTSKEAKPFMEEYRVILESTEFIVRSPIRRSSTSKNRGKSASKDRKIVTVTVSIGIAEYSGNQTKPEKVLKAADKILYKAKHLGRNRVEIQKKK